MTNITDWAALPDTKVAITGATGWIGMAMAHFCCDLGFDQPSGRLRLFGAAKRTVLTASRSLEIESLAEAPPLGGGQWIVIHLAFLGKERTRDMATIDFVRINDALLQQTKTLAETAESLRFIFSSSGAVYTADRTLVGETGNAYGYTKVKHEADIRAWAKNASVPLVNARIFNIGGPYINKQSLYALSDFITQVQRSSRIHIGAAKPVFRSFVHVMELCQVLLQSVLPPLLDYICFDTGGRETVEIGDLALSVASVLGKDISIERPIFSPDADVDWYVGDGRIYQSIMAACGMRAVCLNNIIRDTVTAIV